jgi:ABC-type lipoprotein release transport system permease subunit
LFKGGVKITDEVSGEVRNYLYREGGVENNKRYEVRAFFNTRKGSISEARRLAYYRALATRNQLLSFGIDASNITIKVGNSEQAEDMGKVNIYLK